MSEQLEGEVIPNEKSVVPAHERPLRWEYVITGLPTPVWRDNADEIEAIPLETALIGRRQ